MEMGQENSTEAEGTGPKKQSPFGIVAFAIGLISCLAVGVLSIGMLWGGVTVVCPWGPADCPIVVAGLLIGALFNSFLLTPVIAVVNLGFAFGIAAMFHRGRGKVFAIIGIGLNAIPLVLYFCNLMPLAVPVILGLGTH